ncbi:MAG: amidohydrolase [Lachnospiraceae bacterium]|nr:amidohydrolase [Lachnospiraceae bacterium]
MSKDTSAIRIYNARIITMDPAASKSSTELTVIKGEIHIDSSLISYVGPSSTAPVRTGWNREIDADGNILMPGFKNAHTHSGMTFLRSYADDLPLHQWLYDKVFPLEAKLTPDDIYWCSRLAILEYLTSGITANFDMYQKTPSIVQASIDSGFRTVLCGSVNNYVSSVHEMEQEFLMYNNYDPLISFQLGFHAEYTTSREILEAIASLSHQYKAPVYTHNSETSSEVAECLNRYGATPTAFLDHLGMFEYGGGGFHCIYMTEEDLEIYKKRKLWVITNPASNLKLASGIAPLTHMLDKGIRLAIGTDGPASNNCLDMFREMFLTTSLQKVRNKNAASMDANLVLKMAASDGAHAMGLSSCSYLAPGMQADLILMDIHQPNMQPLNDITKNIVYSGSKQNIKMTMIAGNILYENGQFFVGEDPERIYQKVNEIL